MAVPDALDLLEEDETLDLQGTGFGTIEETIDMNSRLSLLNYITLDVSVLSDLDGVYNEIVTEPVLAIEKVGGLLYVLMTSGFWHRVRVGANGYYRDPEPTTELHFESFHLKNVECTIYYSGQLS